MKSSLNSFGSRATLTVHGKNYEIFRLDALDQAGISTAHLPFAMRILLENLLRTEDGLGVRAEEIRTLANWRGKTEKETEIAFSPARVLMQDFTGVPAVVDLAAMRDAMRQLGGDPTKINPLVPAELVIDHSVQVDEFGQKDSFDINALLEFQRNKERYGFLRWGQTAFRNMAIVPPDTGIVHQVNLEYLARVVFVNGTGQAYPDTLIGTDSHTTMINGLGVLGWGVGGIEAEAAMLGQPVSMLIPPVVGVKLSGKLREGSTATDLVLTVTEMLRMHGVVGKFVEFYGPGLSALTLADRATIANMAPEYGATCGIFPIDEETLRYLRLTGRSEEQVALVEAYCRAQGLFHDSVVAREDAVYSENLAMDLGTVEPSLAGPKRPQDRVILSKLGENFANALPSLIKPPKNDAAVAKSRTSDEMPVHPDATGNDGAHGNLRKPLRHGSVVIAAITSCTNTSNPGVMVAAGLVAKKAVERGLTTPAWVKSSLAPGSLVVKDYLEKAGLLSYLEQLKFNIVGYGCTTCIGNSGPLPQEVSAEIEENDLVVASVLSGNRNFEGRVHPEVRANYLASPPLVVAFALAGRVDLDLSTDAVGTDQSGTPVYLADIWPTNAEVASAVAGAVDSQMFTSSYADVFKGDERWQGLPVPATETYAWGDSTYIRKAPYFDGMPATPGAVADIRSARVLAVLGDSVTTDHISPAGNIKKDSPAGRYLIEHGVAPADFNSYGSRRGNHEAMVRGTFANIRLRNKLVPDVEGGYTRHLPGGDVTSIFEASAQYIAEGTPLLILAGKEYGSGSSRDWAAKGPRLLGVRAVIAESYERIHRSNLVGMGILPLQFLPGQSAESLGLTGEEVFDLTGIADVVEKFAAGNQLTIRATESDGSAREFAALVRIDTPQEALYYKHGGILQYVLRGLAGK